MENIIEGQIVSVIPNAAPTAPQIPYVGEMDFDARNTVLKTLANAAGMRLPNTRVPEGESLLPIGETAKRAMQCEISALPDLMPGLNALGTALKAESPKDYLVPLQGVRMNAHNGGLYQDGKPAHNALAYTPTGFSQLAQFIKPVTVKTGFAENMSALPVNLRTAVFNHWSANATIEGQHCLRTFVSGNGRRIVKAVASERHSQETGDDLSILGALMNLPKGAKLRATRTPGGTYSEIEVIWPAMERQLVVGDVAYLAIRIRNSETKGSALKVEPTLLRVLCYNFTTAYADGLEEELTLRHVGDLGRKLPRLIKRASDALEPFVRAFADAFKNELPGNKTRGEVLGLVRSHYALPETTVARAAALWDADGVKSAGNTLAGLSNALTRASQEQAVDMASITERAAGEMLVKGWDAILN